MTDVISSRSTRNCLIDITEESDMEAINALREEDAELVHKLRGYLTGQNTSLFLAGFNQHYDAHTRNFDGYTRPLNLLAVPVSAERNALDNLMRYFHSNDSRSLGIDLPQFEIVDNAFELMHDPYLQEHIANSALVVPPRRVLTNTEGFTACIFFTGRETYTRYLGPFTEWGETILRQSST